MSLPAEQMPVNISIKTVIQNENGREAFELATVGRYYQKGGSSFLQYEEVSEDGTINTILKISSDEALILRSGAIKMRMKFNQHKKMAGRYETPYGALETAAVTKRLSHLFNEQTRKGSVELVYDLTIHGSHAGTYKMTIWYEEEGK